MSFIDFGRGMKSQEVFGVRRAFVVWLVVLQFAGAACLPKLHLDKLRGSPKRDGAPAGDVVSPPEGGVRPAARGVDGEQLDGLDDANVIEPQDLVLDDAADVSGGQCTPYDPPEYESCEDPLTAALTESALPECDPSCCLTLNLEDQISGYNLISGDLQVSGDLQFLQAKGKVRPCEQCVKKCGIKNPDDIHAKGPNSVTFYNAKAGACMANGKPFDPNALTVSVPACEFRALKGKTITFTANAPGMCYDGNSVTVTVTDCGAGVSHGGGDLSPAAFRLLVYGPNNEDCQGIDIRQVGAISITRTVH